MKGAKKMAGYQDDFSKSNNAVEAENSGLFPASLISKKLRVPATLIKDNLEIAEFHHTSSWYNETAYYDLDECKTFFETETGLALIKKYNESKNEVSVFINCTVKWLEWSGTRNYPRCSEHSEHGAEVRVKGKTATIIFSNGKTMTKRLTTNGFSFISN